MKVQPAQLHFGEDGLPRSTLFDDVYYSDASAPAESEQVFIAPHDLATRWRRGLHGRDHFVIAELGFGFGLNFLLTLRHWMDHCHDSPLRHLHYIGFEKYPPDAGSLQRVHSLWPELAPLGETLRRLYPHQGSGCHRLHPHDRVVLDLYLGDGEAQLGNRVQLAGAPVDCWYLDGFAPAKNNELWRDGILEQVAAGSAEGTTVSSYSVAGDVRRSLNRLGFKVARVPGFGRKRHALFAVCDGRYTAPDPGYWLPQARHHGADARSVTVIGAGIAGCAAAHSLARRNWRVTVINAHKDLSQGVNGIPRLALRPRLFHTPSPEARFYLLAYLYSLRQFDELAAGQGLDWNPVGLVQLEAALNKKRRPVAGALAECYDRELLLACTREQLNGIAGIDVAGGGYYLPAAGSVNPASLTGAYLHSPNITLINNCEVTTLQKAGACWRMQTATGETLTDHTVILANGFACTRFSQLEPLPLSAIGGQVTHIATTPDSEKLKTILCGRRTLFPGESGSHLIAASYGDSGSEPVDSGADYDNLALARGNFQNPRVLGETVLGSHGALRCRSGDFLPVIGPVPRWRAMADLLAPLSHNARSTIREPGSYQPGLYVSTAHGSNGLVSCPLAGEYLASLINRENPPLDGPVIHRLHPLRFLVRSLKRQRRTGLHG